MNTAIYKLVFLPYHIATRVDWVIKLKLNIFYVKISGSIHIFWLKPFRLLLILLYVQQFMHKMTQPLNLQITNMNLRTTIKINIIIRAKRWKIIIHCWVTVAIRKTGPWWCTVDRRGIYPHWTTHVFKSKQYNNCIMLCTYIKLPI